MTNNRRYSLVHFVTKKITYSFIAGALLIMLLINSRMRATTILDIEL